MFLFLSTKSINFVICVLIEALSVVFDVPSQIQLYLGFSFPNLITGCLDNISVFLPRHLCLLPPSACFLFFVWVLPGAPIPISHVEKTYTELVVFLLLIKISKQLSEDLSKHTLFCFFPRGKNIPLAAGGILGANTFVCYMSCWISWGRFI